MNDIFGFHEIKAVVQARRCKLHTHLIGKLVKGNEVRCVFILHRHTEADILHAHFPQGFQGRISFIKTVLQTADFVIRLL